MPDVFTPDRPPIPHLDGSEDLKSFDYSELVGDRYRPQYCGGMSDVYVGSLRRDGAPDMKVAIKVLRMGGELQRSGPALEGFQRRFIRETRVWKELNQKNILILLGLSEKLGRGCPALITPYCDQGTVMEYLHRFPGADRISLVRGVAEGLAYLHGQQVVHGDLRPPNILIDEKGVPLLSDFGSARLLVDKGFSQTNPAGAVRYQAPEPFDPDCESSGFPDTYATDVYAFAMTSYEIWAGVKPYRNMHDNAILMNLLLHDARPTFPDPSPPQTTIIWPLLVSCWVGIPEKRLTAEEVVRMLASPT